MAGFRNIIGHQDTVTHLKRAIESGKTGHAYLFQGEQGSGKRLIAEAFAGTLQCEVHGTDMCQECHSCRQAISHNHPDIIFVTHEKPGTIGVDDIREQLVGDISIKPYNGNYKIYIIEEAEKLTVQAQNALLKTLEEPPAYAVILLLTSNAASLLETIRSRCMLLNLRPVPDERVREYLMEHLEIPDYQAEICVAFSQGNIGKALALASSENFNSIKAAALSLVVNVKKMETGEIVSAMKEISQYKVEIQDFLDILAVWFRDILYFKATRDVAGITFRDQLRNITENANTRSYEGLELILQALQTAKIRLDANVNFELVMELLFLTIKEN